MKPNQIWASLAASAAWLLPPLIALLTLAPRNNDNAMAAGLLMVFIPVAVLVGAGIWYLVGRNACSKGPPPRGRFVLRTAGIFAAIGAAWGLKNSLSGPFPDMVTSMLIDGTVLGLTAIPAALLWWWLGVKPLRAP